MLKVFVDHGYHAGGAFYLWIRRFCYNPQADTWQLATSLLAEAVRNYWRKKKLSAEVMSSGILFYQTVPRS